MGPLAGAKVVEFAGIGPGPMCAMLLGDLGADVVRIDRLVPSELGLPVEGRFDTTSRSRRSIALDLKADAGREVAMRLVDAADVLIEGFRPGVAERLGFGPEACLERNPRLVYGRMTGFGQSGPLAHAAGHDINYLSLTGALAAIGPRDGAPLPPLNLIADYGGGALYLAFGIVSALFERQSSNRGQVVDAAMVDGAASLMTMFYGMRAAGSWSESRGDNFLDGGAPFYGTYATADGRYIAVGALEGKFFAQLAQRIGLEQHFVDGQYDRSLWPAMRARLTAIFAARSRDAWCDLLEGTDCCVTPVLTMSEAPTHRHNGARASFVEVDGVVQPAPAPRFSRSVTDAPRPTPDPGQHSRAIMLQAGMSANQIEALFAAGVVK